MRDFIVVLCGLYISLVASAQTPPPAFVPPPPSTFIMPPYPTPLGLQAQIINPYFMGETQWTPPGSAPTLYTKYRYPKKTKIRLRHRLRYEPTVYYDAELISTPDALTVDPETEIETKNIYKIRGDDVTENLTEAAQPTPNDKNKSVEISLKRPTYFYRSTPVQNTKDGETQAAQCDDCKPHEGSAKSLDNVEWIRLRALKEKILASGKVPKEAFTNAWNYFESNADKIRQKDLLTVVDYSLPSDQPRLFLINLISGNIESHLVSHGINSSGNGKLRKYAVRYSNKEGSRQSSHGAFLTGETYKGKFGYSLKIDGQSSSNDKARSRYIVVHPWNVTQNGAQDTHGCFGLSPAASARIINKIKNGRLLYVEPYS